MGKMSDKELIKVVTGFRRGILGRRKSTCWCWRICLPLEAYLIGIGVDNRITEGEVHLASHNKGINIGHFWLTLSDGRIIDPTADQFNGMGHDDMPKVYLGKKPDYYKTKA